MKTIIVGAGFTGIQLARSLVAEGGDVVLIDNDAEKTRHARDLLDCTVIDADGNNPETLEDAGIADAAALVALTEDDEVNMITCSLADAGHPEVLKIARVRNYAYYERTEAMARRLAGGRAAAPGRPLFGIDRMLSPDVEAAKAIFRAMAHGAVGNVIELGGGHGVIALPVAAGSPLDGTPLRSLAERYRLLAWAETPDGPILPNGGTVLHAGDRVGVVAPLADIPGILKTAAIPSGEAPRRIAIFGAGRIGTLVAERQLAAWDEADAGRLFGQARSGRDLVMVDADPERCRDAAERFAKARVLCGDITEADFLGEESLNESDLMVAASSNHERNLIVAAYLKSRGVRRAVALTASAEFEDIARRLGVDVAVPLRETVVDSILSHLRGKSVKAIHSVCNRAFEIVECDIAADGRAAGKALRDLSEPGEYLVLLVRQPGSETYEVARGDTLVRAGGRAVLVVRAGDHHVIRLFGGRS